MMNPYEKYQQQMVTTMTQGEMLTKLYDESIKQIQRARVSIQSGNISDMDQALKKTLKIIRYLKSTLDFRFPIAKQLSRLYDFFDTQLTLANIKKDAQLLDDVEPLIKDLRDTYVQCDKINRTSGASSSMTRSVV